MRKFITASPLILALLTTPLSAQQKPTPLVVERVNDPTLAVGSTAPSAALNSDVELTSSSDVAVEIEGVAVPDAANMPGRTDERDRVLHHGGDVRFLSARREQSRVQILQPNWMLAHYINVGQGNATLLEFSCGVILIDTGGQVTDQFNGTLRLVEYLYGVFARRPDLNRTISALFLTHPHKGHTAGVTTLLAATPAITLGSVIVNGRTNGSGWNEQNRIIGVAGQRGIPVTVVANEAIRRSDGLTPTAIDTLSCADVVPDIRVLWGSDSGALGWTSEANNHSLVISVDFGESSFLFTGDMEETAQPEFIGSYVRNPDIIDADIYQVGHHGSRNGTTSELLRVMSPEIAVIGAGNPGDEEPGFSAFNFAHPNRVTIDLLANPSFGVSMTRPAVIVPVGIRGRPPGSNEHPQYANQEITRATFSTG